MRSDLFASNLESTTADRFTVQNSCMLRVALDGEVMARQGAMVATSRSTPRTKVRGGCPKRPRSHGWSLK